MCLFWLLFNFLYLIANEPSFVTCQDISSSGESVKRVLNVSMNTRADQSQNYRIHEERIENKFLIKPNTIIRTGESRALGAKYLNETSLPSNYDCLMWCFETPSCNAAVYEQKNMQSCYLFDCGSPAKPLCRFTPHAFFMSSILKISQHSYELSQWSRQVQLERSNTEHHSDIITTSPAPLNVSTVSSSPVLSTNMEQPKKKGNGCHHYQFQCLNSSECIAIYNVCDGIPQCPDESDESSELKCPNRGMDVKEVPANVNSPLPNKTPVLKEEPPVPHPSAAFTGIQNIQPHKKPPEHNEMQRKEDYKGVWPNSNSYSNSQMTKSGYHHHADDSRGLGSPFIHKHSQFISANDPHLQSLNRWANDYDQYPSHSTSLEQQYNPYERMDDQYLSNPLPADYDAGKGFSGYHPDDLAYWPSQDTVPDNSYNVDEFPQPVQNLNKVMSYPDKENAYVQQIARTAEQFPETKLGMHKPISNQNQPPDMDEYKLPRYPHSRPQPYLGLEDSLQQRFSNYPEMKAKGFNPLQNGDDPMYNNDDLIRASIINQLPPKIEQIHHVHEQTDKDWHHHSTKETNTPESAATSKDTSYITVKPTSRTKAIQRTVLDFKMSVAELYESSSTHAHEANSAILALVVGVTVAFLLIVLLACRLKTLRRRMSRKGRGLAHDADYLVNGMYL